MIRRYGEAVKPETRYTQRPGAYVILFRGTDLLLTLQDGEAPELQLPGGGVDTGEQVLPALHREVLEETGWKMTGPRRLGAFRRFTFMPEYNLWAEKLCAVYVAQPALRTGPPLEAGHHAVWVPAQDAPRLLSNEGDAAFTRQFLASSRFGR